jgi:acylphosphatase
MSRTEHVVIRGRVQGIGYRAWARHQAQLHGLSGWVRNRRDGAVEAVMAGPDDAIAAMLKALAQGPQGARVTEIEHLADNGRVMVSDGFEILATA